VGGRESVCNRGNRLGVDARPGNGHEVGEVGVVGSRAGLSLSLHAEHETLNAMTFGMANVFGGDGIRVNAIAPGVMDPRPRAPVFRPAPMSAFRGSRS
jgi:hypothetical protein